MGNKDARRFPVISLGAEHLVIGHLMRRNVLAYKAPPNNEGYDLICIHPDPTKSAEQIRIQVKSRYQTDCDRAFPVKAKTFGAFDYLVIAFLNIGYYYRRRPVLDGVGEPEFYTLPVNLVRENHTRTASGWENVHTKHLDLESFKNDRGFEIIARDLGVPYPGTIA